MTDKSKENQGRPSEWLPEVIAIDTRDLENIMRHTYLLGCSVRDKEMEEAFSLNAPKEAYDDWESEREEMILDLLQDFRQDGDCCYGDICGSVEHTEVENK